MMGTRIDLKGQKFGRLEVVDRGPMKDRRSTWVCRCDCGKTKTIQAIKLTKGRTKSCGCLHREMICGGMRTTHGFARQSAILPEYMSWKTMIARCCNPKNPKYKDYGGRGITVCERWRSSFECFLTDMGRRPSAEHSIDRANNDGNYNPENCRWATRHEQSNNRRSNHLLTIRGETRTIAEWARKHGLRTDTVKSRIYRGASPEDAVAPLQRSARG